MVNIEEQIRELNALLDEAVIEIDKLTQEIKNLKGKTQDLESKEKEINNLRDKLRTCQAEKDNISQQLTQKIKEIEQSNLSDKEKSKQIIKLAVDNRGEIDKLNNKLTDSWTNFIKSRDMFAKISQELSSSRLKSIQSIEKTKWNL